jgi:hypothetical protein
MTAQKKRLVKIIKKTARVYWNDSGDSYHRSRTGHGMAGPIYRGTIAQAEAAGKTNCESCMSMK